LFLSLFSSFSLCLFVIGFDKQKVIHELFKFNLFNLITSSFIIIIPMIFYAFLNFSISYNVLYLLITIIMITSYASHIYDKR
jgi:hypothetical protein